MTSERRATIWLFSMCVIWGSSFFSTKLGLEGVTPHVGGPAAPAAFIFLRFAAATALFPIVFWKSVRSLTGRTVMYGLLLALPFYAGFILQVMGLRFTTATVSAFLTNLTVLLTPLLGRMFFGETLRAANLLGAVVALGGVYLLTDPAGGGLGRGELLTVACAVAFTVQIQLTNVITRRSDPEGVTFVMFACAVLFSGTTLLVMQVPPSALVRSIGAPHVAWSTLYNAVVCSVAAITIMNRFQRDISATRAAVLYTIEPVFAALMAWAFMAELMTPRQIAGGAVILGGNLLCELLGRRPVPVKEKA